LIDEKGWPQGGKKVIGRGASPKIIYKETSGIICKADVTRDHFKGKWDFGGKKKDEEIPPSRR